MCAGGCRARPSPGSRRCRGRCPRLCGGTKPTSGRRRPPCVAACVLRRNVFQNVASGMSCRPLTVRFVICGRVAASQLCHSFVPERFDFLVDSRAKWGTVVKHASHREMACRHVIRCAHVIRLPKHKVLAQSSDLQDSQPQAIVEASATSSRSAQVDEAL